MDRSYHHMTTGGVFDSTERAVESARVDAHRLAALRGLTAEQLVEGGHMTEAVALLGRMNTPTKGI
jgi:hypothetical protein